MKLKKIIRLWPLDFVFGRVDTDYAGATYFVYISLVGGEEQGLFLKARYE